MIDKKLLIDYIKSGDFDLPDPVKETCTWELKAVSRSVNTEFLYSQECMNTLFNLFVYLKETDFRYCPYCGLEIKEIDCERDKK
jgi:hypothetical protein